MDLYEFKRQQMRHMLGLESEKYPCIVSFIDFGNVNYWYENDNQDSDGLAVSLNQRIGIDLERLLDFLKCFSDDVRFYYGHDPANTESMAFHMATKHIFGKNRVFTKQIQKIKHYLDFQEIACNTRAMRTDGHGSFVIIPKCNFDVEISVDSIRLAEKYDTLCLLSSDADFVSLLRYLKTRGKKIIIIKGGRVQGDLGAVPDITINAQDIKRYITKIKQKPGSSEPGFADR